MHTIIKKLYTLATASLLLFLSFQELVSAALVVTPTRIEFDARTRSEQVTLLNTGSESASYRISFKRRHMLEDGNLIEVKKGEKGNFADEMIRYSPRQVTLPPGKSQVIRLMLRKPRNLEDGEYRSHMLFQALPKATNTLDDNPDTKSEGITIQLTPMIGITIPVIIRHGTLDAALAIEDVKFLAADKKNPQNRISLNMVREGTRSVYGDFKVTFTPEGNTVETVVSQIKGVAVYTPNLNRRYALRLNQPPGISFDKGTFNIIYSERNKYTKTKSPILIETKLTRP